MKCRRFLLQVTTAHFTYLSHLKISDSGLLCLADFVADRNSGCFMPEIVIAASLLLLEACRR